MTSPWTDAEIEAHIVTLKAEWSAVCVAITAILGGAQSYTMDTGQTRQTVTKANLTELRKHRAALWEEIQDLQDSLTGAPSFVARPGFG